MVEFPLSGDKAFPYTIMERNIARKFLWLKISSLCKWSLSDTFLRDKTGDRGRQSSEAESDKNKENGDNTMKDPGEIKNFVYQRWTFSAYSFKD